MVGTKALGSTAEWNEANSKTKLKFRNLNSYFSGISFEMPFLLQSLFFFLALGIH